MAGQTVDGWFELVFPRGAEAAEPAGKTGESDGVLTVTFNETVVSAPGADPETVEVSGSIAGRDTSSLFIRIRVN
ncbi:MAG: hypothetical protein AAF636_11360 [Pseudomonadota bacterium]